MTGPSEVGLLILPLGENVAAFRMKTAKRSTFGTTKDSPPRHRREGARPLRAYLASSLLPLGGTGPQRGPFLESWSLRWQPFQFLCSSSSFSGRK